VRRRDFTTLVGGAVATWPLAALGQKAGMPVVGLLGSGSLVKPFIVAFHQGLNEFGYVEGQNVKLEFRWADGQFNRLPDMAADLVDRQASVIVAMAMPAPFAAQAATRTIPIVFTMASDPVMLGLVGSFNRPGGNITGVTAMSVEVGQKQLEFLHELVPATKVVGLLLNDGNPLVAENLSKIFQAAARALSLKLHVLHASTEHGLDAAFANAAQIHADGLVIGADPFFNSHSAQIAALALRHKIPTTSFTREFASAGGLMSYVGSFTEIFRVAGAYTGRILKGEKPADLPIQQATKIELIVNLKTAKALGLDVPAMLLARADEVIE
jgi:putative ABC transport system substrate-binding protein